MFHRQSVRKKLALTLWGGILLAFAIVGVGLVLYQNLTLENRVLQIMEPYAHLVSVGTDAAVAFEDPVRAREVLDTLKANPQILGAFIVLGDGRVLASFNSAQGKPPRDLLERPPGIYFNNGMVELLRNLPQGARLSLVMSLGQLRRQMHQTLWLFGAAGLILFAITFGLLAVLQRTIIRPIATLAEAAEGVRSRADYECRVPASGNDEIARLGQNFNAMLAAVREREQDLRRSTLFQRTLLDNAAYAIVSATPDGTVTSFNPAAERLTGYPAAEVLGNATPLLWHDPEEMEQRARDLSEELGETVTPGFEVFAARARLNLPEENEWTFVRRDGTRVPVLLSVTALRDEQGEPTGFVGLVSDLSERKQAQEALQEKQQLLLEAQRMAHIGNWWHDLVTGEMYWSDEFFRILGIEPQEPSLELAAQCLHPDDWPLLAKGLEESAAGKLENEHDFRIVRPDGEIRWVHNHWIRVNDKDGQEIKRVGTYQDITEQKLAEESLRQLNTELDTRVQERTAELETKNAELEKLNKLFVGRELRMMELKKRIDELEKTEYQ